jgi:hypothetical protein
MERLCHRNGMGSNGGSVCLCACRSIYIMTSNCHTVHYITMHNYNVAAKSNGSIQPFHPLLYLKSSFL